MRDYDIDLIHSHNAPDFLTESALKSASSMPIIHDNHDVLSLRKTRYGIASVEPEDLKTLETERFVNEQSDGRIYASEGLNHYVQQKYKVDPSRDLVFPNYLSRSYIPTRLRTKLSEKDGQTHIVYEGTVDSQISSSHYDLMSIFEDIAKQYSSSSEKDSLSDLAHNIFKTKDTRFKLAMICWSIGTLAFSIVLVTSDVVPAIIGWIGIVASILIGFNDGIKLVKPQIKVPPIGALFALLFEVIIGGWLLFSSII